MSAAWSLSTRRRPYAGLIRRAIAEVTDKPITHLIYSHSHIDHIGGAKGLDIPKSLYAQGWKPDSGALVSRERT